MHFYFSEFCKSLEDREVDKTMSRIAYRKQNGSKNQCRRYQYMSNSIFSPSSICSQRKFINGQVNRLDKCRTSNGMMMQTNQFFKLFFAKMWRIVKNTWCVCLQPKISTIYVVRRLLGFRSV